MVEILVVAMLIFLQGSGTLPLNSIKTGDVKMKASWYGSECLGQPLASDDQETFDPENPRIVAHKSVPMGTIAELSSERTGKKTWAVVLDRGPFVDGLDLDVSRKIAENLGFVEEGKEELHFKILGKVKVDKTLFKKLRRVKNKKDGYKLLLAAK